jgi:alpha-mannosidase
MYTDRQIEKMLGKVRRFEDTLEAMIFDRKDSVDFKIFRTTERLTTVPADELFEDIKRGETWGGEHAYAWFKTTYTVPAELDGQAIYIWPDMNCYEGMLFVDGVPYGIFANKVHQTAHGNHYCALIDLNAKAGKTYEIAIELYAGHYIPGCAPLKTDAVPQFVFEYNGADICIKNAEIADIYFDLYTLNRLVKVTDSTMSEFRRGEIINALNEVHNRVLYAIEDTTLDEFMTCLRSAVPFIKDALSVKSDDSAPTAAIVGHSHMDTAWLWPVVETEKKCARTYSNQIALMDEYPEYRFVQSSSCHSDFIRRQYPELFKRIQKRVKSGEYEPNGAVWVECDCNITGGEAMVRQFLWGQRFTRKHFNYTSNCFWLPDTFGYSAAIPQIMKSCAVDYFLTTKISWNDTNAFPFDTFWWEGLDGTRVFSHFNTTHHFPDAEDVPDRLGAIKQKSVTNTRLLAFGYGDGGGGPQFEEIELARRIKDISGIGKTEFRAVGDFMQDLEKSAVNPDTYKGELYLELHRGTLTNQHTIKRNNRKSEIALHNLEYLTVNNAVKNKEAADIQKINELWQTLLLNQFHDILPGTCINIAHEVSRKETHALLEKAGNMTVELTASDDNDYITFINPCSFDRNDVIFTEFKGKYIKGNYAQQVYTNLDGVETLMIAGVKIPAYESVSFELCDNAPENTAFENKYYDIDYAENMTIKSLFDKAENREIKAENGYNLGSLIMAEDVPNAWDNWDIDADVEAKFKDVSNLIKSELVSSGSVCTITRNTYKISAKSTVTLDVIIFADSREIRYDCAMDWQDDHRLLKIAFDTDIRSDFARQEIQFGYVNRPTTRNNSIEKAKFEVLNHKYSDISETRYGVAVLNDCKYGISVEDGNMRLTLHKGGTRPDHKGDHDGIHRAVFSLLPHNSGFSVPNVTKYGYLLNYPVIPVVGNYEAKAPFKIDADNVIIETIKPCEDSENAFIVRAYEAEGTQVSAKYSTVGDAYICNMLEEEQSVCPEILTFKPFEIKTIKVKF